MTGFVIFIFSMGICTARVVAGKLAKPQRTITVIVLFFIFLIIIYKALPNFDYILFTSDCCMEIYLSSPLLTEPVPLQTTN